MGSLLYTASVTYPAISHSVGVLSKLNVVLFEAYVIAARIVLRYLKGTNEYGLVDTKSDSQSLA